MNLVKDKFQEENDQLLKFMLNERFFKPWLEPNEPGFDEMYSLNSESFVELYITNRCNQACEYCYLYHNDAIYPPEINNRENILNNLESFYDWVIKNNFSIPRIELFSGEIWHTQLGLDVLEITSRALMSGLRCKEFMIASNGFFISKDETLQPIQGYINEFSGLGSRLLFSLSIDGAIIEDLSRPLAGVNVRPEDFYEKVFAFVHHNDYSFHPMIAACSIEEWPENWKWWRKMYNKYEFRNSIQGSVMMLEVRNDDWTDDKIEKYCEFIKNLADEFYREDCFNNRDNCFFDFCLGDSPFEDHKNFTYVPWVLSHSLERAGCTISDCMTIRLGDLAICPCHRTAYEKNLYGHFILNDDKEIIDISSENIYMANRILLANNNLCSLKCDSCVYNPYCLKGCFGSQLENSNDPFLPIKSVCKLFKRKIETCIEIYEKYGVLEYISKLKPEHPFYFIGKDIENFCERVKKANEMEEIIQNKLE